MAHFLRPPGRRRRRGVGFNPLNTWSRSLSGIFADTFAGMFAGRQCDACGRPWRRHSRHEREECLDTPVPVIIDPFRDENGWDEDHS